ncbi:MAG TPA: polysaccharide biosynthesis tyrosine autokinase, partial [Desulfatiglandales bacterium]|nr:polysaccharide biosynthesis tyrosine autokinase [Desulfatiglandales bacterium]
YYQTQYKIIESRTVAREVIKRLRLEDSQEFFPKPKNDFLSSLKLSIQETVIFWKDSILSLLKTDGEGISKKIGEYAPDSSLVSNFIGRITVSPIRNSRLVDVNFQAIDPVLAARIVNTLADSYIDRNLETKLRAIQDAVKWLHSRIEEERQRVENAEQALLRYKEKHSIVTDFSSDVENITAQKLAQLNSQVVEAESKRVEAETRYKQAMAMEGTPDMLDSIPEVLNNELIRQIKSMEVELYKRTSELSKKYGQKHPQMVAIDSEIETLRKRKAQEVNRVINSLKNEYKVSLAKEDSLKAALVKQKNESLDLNQKAIEYGVLRREAESARQMYELLIKRFKETSLTEDMKTGNIRIIDRAEVPQYAVKPKKRLNILLAIIVGLVTGTGLAFFFDYLDNTIKTPEDVKQYLRIPYLGLTPLFSTKSKGNPAEDKNLELVAFHSSRSTASESYRGIRTSILFSLVESAPKSILITSSGPREGKTITSANLAITMAQSGSKVIILDCDMRRPKIHKLFGVSKEKGIANLLVKKNDIKETIIHTRIPNLDIIPSGPIPPNPSELLGSSRMADLLDKLKKHYNHIIIDSPPSTAVTDAVVLSKSVDGVVLVVRAGDTVREIARNGVTQLQNIGARILGAILNGVDINADSYYYYQYYYYYYGEDGERNKKSHKKKKSKGIYDEEV